MHADSWNPADGIFALAAHPSRRWQDTAERARHDIAELLSRALAEGRLGRRSYQDWLAMEAEVCRIGTLSLVAIANWHRAQPALRDAALAWAAGLDALARDAADDIRSLDGIAAALPEPVRRWRAFAEGLAGSQRAGEVLGAVLLHGYLPGGPGAPVLKALAAANGSASLYLARRAQASPELARERIALLDAYAGSALALGVQRAAGWYLAASAALLAA